MDEFWEQYFEGQVTNPWVTYEALLAATGRTAIPSPMSELAYSSSEGSPSPVRDIFIRAQMLRARVQCGDTVLLIPANKPGLTVADLTMDAQKRALHQCPEFWRQCTARSGGTAPDLRLFRMGVVAPALRRDRRVSDAVSDMELLGLRLMQESECRESSKTESTGGASPSRFAAVAGALAALVSVLACAVAGFLPLRALHLPSLSALPGIGTASSSSPAQHRVWYHRSRALLDAGEPANAALHIERALELEPRSSNYWATLARARQRLGKAEHEPAAKAFEMALHLDPLHEGARYFYAQLLEERGQLREARTQLSVLLAAQPARADVCWALGNVLEKEGRVLEAVQMYRTVTEGERSNSKAWLALGRTLHASGSASDATAALAHALALDPSSGHTAQAMGRALEATGQHEPALAQYKAAATLRVRDPAPLISIGSLVLARGDAAMAMQSFKAAAALDPANADTISHLVKAATVDGRLEEAEHFARQALRAAPLRAAPRRALVGVLEKQGRDADAAQERLKAATMELDEIW